MSLTPPAAPPGWYPSPGVPGWLQWWDGVGWAPYRWPLPGTTAGPDVSSLAEQERSEARTAAAAVLAGGVLYLIQAGLTAFAVHDVVRLVHGTSSSAFTPGPLSTLRSGVTSIAGLGTLVVGALFLVWFHRAATLAAALGIPARYRPVWAVLGFIIPFANFVVPYQVARDLLPPDHGGTGMVGRWWASWIAMSLVPTAALVLWFFAPVVAVGVEVLHVVLVAVAVVLARRLIREVTAAHAALLARSATTPG